MSEKPKKIRPTTKSKPNPSRPKSSTERIFGLDVMSHGYTAIPNMLVRGQARLGLNPTQFNILVQLLSYYIDPAKPPFPSKKELCLRIGVSKGTLQKEIRALEGAGFLRRQQNKTQAGDWGSNTYHLNGLVEQLKKRVPDFDKERQQREDARRTVETPNAHLGSASDEKGG